MHNNNNNCRRLQTPDLQTYKHAISVYVSWLSDLCVLDVCEEAGRPRLLLLRDGGGELALLDVVQPPQLFHAHLTASHNNIKMFRLIL